jgi:hypothetical protein
MSGVVETHCSSLGSFISPPQYKFDALIAQLAGNDGSQFFGVTSKLGPGFFLLMAYCFVGGLSQYLLNSAVSQYHQIDLNRKVGSVWTKMFGCLLVHDEESTNADSR